MTYKCVLITDGNISFDIPAADSQEEAAIRALESLGYSLIEIKDPDSCEGCRHIGETACPGLSEHDVPRGCYEE